MADKRLKDGLKQLKDLLFPGRKRRREQIAALNQHVCHLQTELDDTKQQVETVFQNLAKIGQQIQVQHDLIGKTANQLHSVQQDFSDQQSKLVSETVQLKQVAIESGDQIEELLEKVTEIESYKSEQLQFSQQLGQQQLHFSELKNEAKVWQDSTVQFNDKLQKLNEQVLEFERTVKNEIESIRSINPTEIAATAVDQRVPGIITELSPPLIADHVQTVVPDLCHQIFGSKLQESGLNHTISQQKTLLDRLQQRISMIEKSFEATAKGQYQPASANILSERSGSKSLPNTPEEQNTKATPNPAKPSEVHSRFCLSAYDCYAQEMADTDARFIYLDVKSIPRSGLHYMQRTLRGILENQISFCEWYQEPGCCKQMPCGLTGFAKRCKQDRSLSIRMIKSHDFDLSDPVFTEKGSISRIVLIRDPLFSLSSYWNLQSLQHNYELLKHHGIDVVKVNYLHEKPVLEMAFKLIDSVGRAPSEDSLLKWLENTKAYYLGFIGKWGEHVPRESIIGYRQINEFLIRMFEGLIPSLPVNTQQRYKNWADRQQNSFQPRTDPFFSHSERMKDHLNRYADLFKQFSEEIVQADQTGLFASCLEPIVETTTDKETGRTAGEVISVPWNGQTRQIDQKKFGF